jgi:hydrogenase maturation protein HypF
MTQSARIRVRGQVQGVGFRPFVWQLAQEMGIRGEVLNDPEGVLVLAFGNNLDGFATAIRTRAPKLAKVDAVEVETHVFPALPTEFVIAASQGQGTETRVTPDAATCPACAAEIRDTAARRHGYAFTNCTHCGPRFSILHGIPYDRARTSMSGFTMCPACRAEYADPGDRRFHAQPIACPSCGPRIWLEQTDGTIIKGDALTLAADRLRAGDILAIKGLGGFHLACDATNAATIARLRHRKRRPAKPFALMAPLNVIRQYATMTSTEAVLLQDPAAPIVLLGTSAPLPSEIAPGMVRLGWMLPYTPLHHLLLDAFAGPLVMTSGNLSGEPQAIDNAEARQKLHPFADAFLMHDRDIVRRLDDGVEQAGPAGPMVLRRGRGRAPGTLALPPGLAQGPQVLAFGGQMKAAICLLKGDQALLSHHLGDLDDALTSEEFGRALSDYRDLFNHNAEVGACDLHPGYHATLRAEAAGLPLIRVQHHHAHMAACMGDAGWPPDAGPVAGLILDGLGLGTDGTIWGGEILLGTYQTVERIAALRPAPMPGGDAASREPWRNALMRLDQAGLGAAADRLFAGQPCAMLRKAVAQGINAPMSSSAGRLFDAVAAVLGLCVTRQTYEGEAAMRLEAVADMGSAPLTFGPGLDPAPAFAALLAGLEAGVPIARLAGGFQAGLAQAFCAEARHLVTAGRARAIALSGGCFQNAKLLALCLQELQGLTVLTHRQVPANDGGLAFGQALVARARSI